jgi:purine-nucleoside phosphorylase
MSIHISAAKGDIANVVLLLGDPLRAKYIADHYLQKVQSVNTTRNAFYFTGEYQGKRITVGSSGMGCPSIGIYSFELYTEYDVDCIIRIGTCGAYTTDLQLMHMVNVEAAASESTYAKFAWGIDGNVIQHQGKAYDVINAVAKEKDVQIITGAVHSSDIFYRKETGIPAIATQYHCSTVEMEAFALFANAQYLNKQAATLLTVSDVIPTHEKISAAAREKSLLPMMELALEATLQL